MKIKKQIKNRKGATFTGWSEAIMFSALFVVLLGSVIFSMNGLYDKDHDGTFGLDSGGVISNFTQLANTVEEGVQTGEADFSSSSGLTLSSMWTIMRATWTTIGTFITGGWIENVINLAQLPAILGKVLRILYLLSIGFILIKLLLKIKP